MKTNFNLLAVTSFIFSIVGLVMAFVMPFFMQIIALVLGHLYLKLQGKIKNYQIGNMYHSMAIISLVVSYIVIAINIFFLLVMGASAYIFLKNLLGPANLII